MISAIALQVRFRAANRPSLEETLKEFQFRAPALFDGSAKASERSLLAHHDAPGAAINGAKTKRFAYWLTSEMASNGLAASDPSLDEGGWQISTSSSNNGFVLCILSGGRDDEPLFELLVTKIGGATEENHVCRVIERILRNASEITELRIN